MGRVLASFEPCGATGTGRGTLDVAQRPVPLHVGSADLGIDAGGRFPSALCDLKVLYFPGRQSFVQMGERSEQRLVQQLVTQASAYFTSIITTLIERSSIRMRKAKDLLGPVASPRLTDRSP
jgi:hypothetical protein